jgi:hypothetical protein
MSQNEQSKQAVYDYCKAMLGDGMIDVELDPIHYETALNRALAVFRQRSDNAVEESYIFLNLLVDTNEYILPEEIIQIRQLHRRSIGSRTGGGSGGTVFEPFNLAYTNTYLLSSTNMGGLATYELFAGYQELVGKMFGSFINYTWNSQSRKLVIHQRPRTEESVMIHAYNRRPDFALITDTYAGQWIKDYSLANCKMILGQAREKFAQIAGPGGGSSLNGAAMKSEAQAEMDKLMEDLKTGVTTQGWGWVIG